MTNPRETTASRRGRHESLREEQALCNEALESGEFDKMSDQEWVAMCEQLAADSRRPE